MTEIQTFYEFIFLELNLTCVYLGFTLRVGSYAPRTIDHLANSFCQSDQVDGFGEVSLIAGHRGLLRIPSK